MMQMMVVGIEGVEAKGDHIEVGEEVAERNADMRECYRKLSETYSNCTN